MAVAKKSRVERGEAAEFEYSRALSQTEIALRSGCRNPDRVTQLVCSRGFRELMLGMKV